jgi:hypothetical protein
MTYSSSKDATAFVRSVIRNTLQFQYKSKQLQVSDSLALELALALFKTARIVQPKINTVKRACHRTYLRFIKKTQQESCE